MSPRKSDDVPRAQQGSLQATEPAVWPLVSLHRDGYLQVDFSPCDVITLKTVQYVNARHRELRPDTKSPVLLIGGKVGNVEYRAQRFASSPEVREVIAVVAIVARSFLERHLAKMFIMYHRPPYPVHVFSSESEALAWLRGFLPKQP